MGADMVCVLESSDQVKNVVPNLDVIRSLDGMCMHITSSGRTESNESSKLNESSRSNESSDTDYDCVACTFAPECNVAECDVAECNVAEDPVCGRGHCHVIPLWANKLWKNKLTAYLASKRGGILYCCFE